MNLYAFFFGLVALMSVLYHAGQAISVLGTHLSEIFALLFILSPWFYDHVSGTQHSPEFGPPVRGILWGIVSSAVVLLPYALFYGFYFTTACRHHLPVFGRHCVHLHPFVWNIPTVTFFQAVMGHIIGVALPEEYFYRGFLMNALMHEGRLELFGRYRMHVLVVFQALLFALGHVLVDFRPIRFSVFIPALLFGYLRLRTGGLWASILLHGLSNVASLILESGFWG